LCGDARWDRLLKDESPVGKALRTDAVSLANALRTGQLARTIEDLARAPAPVSAAEHEATVATVGKLLKTEPVDQPLIVARLTNLTECARYSLELLADTLDPASFLHAKMENLGGGRSKLVYDFKDAAELQDVVLLPGFDKRLREHLNKRTTVAPPPEADASAKLADGSLELRGAAAWRVGIPFTAPFTVQVKSRWEDRTELLSVASELFVRVCDNEKDACLLFHNSGSCDVYAGGGAYKYFPPVGDWSYVPGAASTWRIEHDGKDWNLARDGDARGRGTAGGLKAGSLVLYVHGVETCCIESIEIVGAFDARACEPQRKAWIAGRMAALGAR
jgi:hypothetical protein